MSPADLSLALFTICNTCRVLAYAPQVARAAKDQAGADAISFLTWGLFFASNVSAIAYAVINVEDLVMALLFLGNAAGCAAILGVGAWKRAQHRAIRQAPPEPSR